jgi:hypothetical protein
MQRVIHYKFETVPNVRDVLIDRSSIDTQSLKERILEKEHLNPTDFRLELIDESTKRGISVSLRLHVISFFFCVSVV